jgi:hypothetical protein
MYSLPRTPELNLGKKRNALIALAMASFPLVCIAIGLPRLVLNAGLPPPDLSQGSPGSGKIVETLPTTGVSGNGAVVVFLCLVLGLGLIALLIAVIARRGLKGLRSILTAVLGFSLAIGALLYLLWLLLPAHSTPIEALPLPLPRSEGKASLGPVPPSLYRLLGIALALLGALLGYLGLRRKDSRPSPAHLLGREAERAREALLEGQDARAAILECYKRMCAILRSERKIERERAMTAAEFVLTLEAAGAPSGCVRELTRLFEAARYGAWEPRPEDGERMLACLDEVILYFRSQGDETGAAYA